MSYFRYFLFLAAFFGLALNGQAQKAQASKVLIKRSYYDHQGQQLHEEYQYIQTATNRNSKHGYYKEFNRDGTLWRKYNYRNNKADGQQLEYFTSGGQPWLEYNMTVHNDLTNGPYVRYSGPGKRVMEGNYVNGYKEGLWTFYEPDGKYGFDGKKAYTYHEDQKNGVAYFYSADGILREQQQYRDNELYGEGEIKNYDEAGKLKAAGTFHNEQREGVFLSWHPNGQLRSKKTYRHNHEEGPSTWYQENGKLDNYGLMRGGFYDGVLTFYDESGLKNKEQDWHDGRPNDTVRVYTPRGQMSKLFSPLK